MIVPYCDAAYVDMHTYFLRERHRTSDHLRSMVYRIVNKLGRERYTIPYLCMSNYDTEVRTVLGMLMSPFDRH